MNSQKKNGSDYWFYLSEFILDESELCHARSVYLDLINYGFKEKDAAQIVLGKLL